MQPLLFGLIVEGQGEVKAAPALIRRIAEENKFYSPIKFEVRRISRCQLVKPRELELAVEALSRKIGRAQPFLVLVDADKDCPKELSQDFQARCHSSHSDLRISFVLAKMEYEAWFLASWNSLSGYRGLATGIPAPPDPESIQGIRKTNPSPTNHPIR